MIEYSIYSLQYSLTSANVEDVDYPLVEADADVPTAVEPGTDTTIPTTRV